ncbi:MAG TPA: MFS transporter [Candidatus Limnocylindrales bacterium]|nr:MFS transporter [Candidatus Limnocylindrales bacterium]
MPRPGATTPADPEPEDLARPPTAPPSGGAIGISRRLPALASPTYRRFIVAAFVGSIGNWMQATAQGWLVLGLTDSRLALGATSAAATAPILVLSIFAGVLADRIDLRRLLAATQLAAAAVAAILAILTATGVVEFWHVLVLAALSGSAGALATPGFQAVVSTIVDRSAIGNAVALNSAQFNLSRVLGPTVAGLIIAAGSIAVAFWANAVGLVLVAFLILSLPIARASNVARVEASLWANLVDGVRYVRAERTIALLVLLAAIPALFILNYLVLMPVFARDILNVGAPGLGLLNASLGVGALSGALGVAFLRPGGGSGRLMLAGLGSASVGLIVFGLSTWLPLSCIALAVLGASQVAYYATTNTLIQVLVAPRLRGRVLSLYILTSLGVIPFGNLLAGAIAERFGSPLALAGGGTATLFILIVVAISFPALRQVRPDQRLAG